MEEKFKIANKINKINIFLRVISVDTQNTYLNNLYIFKVNFQSFYLYLFK